jgi:hypothetical protein
MILRVHLLVFNASPPQVNSTPDVSITPKPLQESRGQICLPWSRRYLVRSHYRSRTDSAYFVIIGNGWSRYKCEGTCTSSPPPFSILLAAGPHVERPAVPSPRPYHEQTCSFRSSVVPYHWSLLQPLSEPTSHHQKHTHVFRRKRYVKLARSRLKTTFPTAIHTLRSAPNSESCSLYPKSINSDP